MDGGTMTWLVQAKPLLGPGTTSGSDLAPIVYPLLLCAGIAYLAFLACAALREWWFRRGGGLPGRQASVVDVATDPGWPGWGFVPGVALVWSRVGRGDGLVWLRWVSLAFGHGPLVVAGLVVLLTASVSRSGVWRPGLAVVVGVGMVVVAVVGVVTRGGLSCVGLLELRQGYITRFLWRAGCAQVVVFVGLFGFLFSGVVWLVVVGVVVSAGMMGWAAPTRWRLGRDQARLVGVGCGLVLVVALRS